MQIIKVARRTAVNLRSIGLLQEPATIAESRLDRCRAGLNALVDKDRLQSIHEPKGSPKIGQRDVSSSLNYSLLSESESWSSLAVVVFGSLDY